MATPSHSTQMHKIFHDAQTHLQVDMTFASSPLGSIDSRLPQHPSTIEPSKERFDLCDEPSVDWRFSIAPESCAGIDHDVREPIDIESPRLPTLPMSARADFSSQEPVSSGFSSPTIPASPDTNFASRVAAGSNINDRVTESLEDFGGNTDLVVEGHDSECGYRSDHDSKEEHLIPSSGGLFASSMGHTELERPMSRLDVSLPDAGFNDALKEERQEKALALEFASSIDIPTSESPSQHFVHDTVQRRRSDDMVIEASSPSLAAAASAKQNRGYDSENNENISPSDTDAQVLSDHKSTPMTRFRRNPFLTPFGHVKSRGSPAEVQTNAAEKAEEMCHPQYRPAYELSSKQDEIRSFAKRINAPSFRFATPILRRGSTRSGVPHGVLQRAAPPNEIEISPEKTFPSGRFVQEAAQTPCKPRKSGAAKFYSNNAPAPSRKTRNKRHRESPSPTRPLFRSSPIREGISIAPAPEGKRIRSGFDGGSVAASEACLGGHDMVGISTGVRGNVRVYDEESNSALPTTTENDKGGLRELSPNVDVTPRSKRNRMGMVFPRKPKERCPSYYDEDVIPRQNTKVKKTDRTA